MPDHPATSDAKRFLDLWFGEGKGKPLDGHILIWENPGKRSSWFQSLEEAAEYAIRSRSNVYFGVSIAAERYSARQRLHSTDRPAKAMCGLQTDIDFGDQHKKKNYPPDEASAFELIGDIPLKPTIVTRTGGGLHAYWCFNEIWTFANDAERAAAQALARRWHHLVLAAAEARGWTLDNVSDLERVMRLPGTFNVKDKKNPRPVTIHEATSWRYEPDEFNTFLQQVADDTPPVSRGTSKPAPPPPEPPVELVDGDIKLSLAAEPPWEKFNALLANDRKAKDTWEHRRKDFKDQSGSSYDQAMANFCVRAGYNLQETANVLIAMRRKHGDENLPRKMRQGYFRNTYQKAFDTFHEQAQFSSKRADVQKRFEDGKLEAATALDEFNEIMGTELTDVVRLQGDNAVYLFRLNDGRTFRLSTQQVFRYPDFRKAYLDVMPKLLRPMKAWEWEDGPLALLISHIQQEGKTEHFDEGSDASRMRGWVEDYFDSQEVHAELNAETAKRGFPWKDDDGTMYLRADRLRVYIGRKLDLKLKPREVWELLKAAGLEPDLKKVKGANKAVRCWRLPAPKGELLEFPKANNDK